MFEVDTYLQALGLLLAVGAFLWMVSVVKRDVSIVDSFWGLMILLAGVFYTLALAASGARAALALILVAIWALRLTGHVTWRNWGEPEDYRYREIRQRNEPGFWLKSLYLVFGLQAVLAWIVSLPFLPLLGSAAPLGALDAAAVALVLGGTLFESAADWQLARFKRDPANHGHVLDTGLWRYSRHPNYFGECCVWWGFYLFAASAGAWWSVVSPLVMTFLLVKISGVALLETTIGRRRPAYYDYVRTTSAFVPMPKRKRTVVRAATDLE
jgi:steroid 5-alpha reductase family enzyme